MSRALSYGYSASYVIVWQLQWRAWVWDIFFEPAGIGPPGGRPLPEDANAARLVS
ncbi:MAG: hypothetical protein M5U15_06665 [Kiritimatiellae bacterium]|nr:hypothetical protein [Kiritimatiellia bacterium]